MTKVNKLKGERQKAKGISSFDLLDPKAAPVLTTLAHLTGVVAVGLGSLRPLNFDLLEVRL